MADPAREKDTAVERCDVSVEDGEGKTKSRFIIKIVCRHGKLYVFKQYEELNVSRGPQNVPSDVRIRCTYACLVRQGERKQ